MDIQIKRIYESSVSDVGFRILVDRLWPRGISKEKIDLWMKEIAPSDELRKWFDHDPKKWESFKKKYTRELEKNEEQVKKIQEYAKKQPVVLLYAAADDLHNNAVVLKEFLARS